MRLTCARVGLPDIGLAVTEVPLQRVDVALPEPLVEADPRVRRGERFRPEGEPMVAAANMPTDQSGLLEDFDVLRDGIERMSNGRARSVTFSSPSAARRQTMVRRELSASAP